MKHILIYLIYFIFIELHTQIFNLNYLSLHYYILYMDTNGKRMYYAG